MGQVVRDDLIAGPDGRHVRIQAVISAEVDEAVLGVAQLCGAREDRIQDGRQIEGRAPQRLQDVADGRLVGDQPLHIAVIGSCHTRSASSTAA